MRPEKYRLGIIGTGRIAHRFVPEARTVNGIVITAVYNPNVESARRFAEEFAMEQDGNGLRVCESLNMLFESVDAVYIASPHGSHYEYTKAAIEAGKHVLCEKPLCFSKGQAEELFDLANAHRVVLMEAIKTAYCPGFQGLLKIIQGGRIGAIVDVEACFTKLVPSDVREVTDLQYGGSFIELGTYVLLPIMKILGIESKAVNFWSSYFESGLDAYTKITLDYGNATATGKVGLGAKSEGELIVTGTQGSIVVPAWWLTNRVEIHYEDPNKVDVFEYPFEGAGLRYEVQIFVKRIGVMELDEDTEEDENHGVSLEESAWIAGLMEGYLNRCYS